MANHDKLGLMCDSVSKGDEVAIIELFAGTIDNWEVLVRVDRGIAMAREVLEDGGDTVFFKAFGESFGHCGDDCRV